MRSNFARQCARRFRFWITFIAAIVIADLPAGTSHATNVTVNGANGADGTPGADVFGGDAGNGAPGGNASANASTSGDTSNSASATGGTGGDGGSGGYCVDCSPGGDGGNGAVGGNASAHASTSTSNSFGSATAYASGGAGGNGGSGGSSDGGSGIGGASAAGGNANASATGNNSSAGGSINVSASAYGGVGGTGGYPGGWNGADGGVATLGTLFGSANNGTVNVHATIQGGSGGQGGFSGGIGGDGADAILINSLGGSTTGTLNLTQDVTGGTGGDANNGTTGIAGTAVSRLTLTNTVASSITGRVNAFGGYGGDGNFIDFGGDGATADADIDITGKGSVTVIAEARGGDGGEGGNGGDGAAVTATAHGASTLGGTVVVDVSNFGGDGRAGEIGGNGADSIVVNEASGVTTGTLRLTQRANGGRAGQGTETIAGAAGNAVSTLTATNAGGGGPLEGTTSAFGGFGGNGSGAAIPSNGGYATATTNLSSSTNTVLAIAEATAGSAGTNGANSALKGIGTASAHATTMHGYLATARASASGRDSVATSQSDTDGGPISAMSIIASASNKASLDSQSKASIGSGFSATVTGFSAMASSDGLPTMNDVNNQLSGVPNVTAAYNASGIHTPLALLAMGLSTSDTPSVTPTLTATANYSFNLGMLTSGNLMVGLLDPSSAGPGFTTLHFTVTREGTAVVDQTFTTLASAMTYFNDQVLSLGPMASGVSGTLDLSISLSMVSPDNDTRFGATLLIADVGPTADPPGDYNDNNVVDAADYVVWRKINNTATTLPNDTTSGSVNNGDYTVWRSHFGHTAVAGSGSGSLSEANVPEPTTSVMLIFAAAGSCLRRGRSA